MVNFGLNTDVVNLICIKEVIFTSDRTISIFIDISYLKLHMNIYRIEFINIDILEEIFIKNILKYFPLRYVKKYFPF